MIFNVGAEGVAKAKKPPLYSRLGGSEVYAQSGTENQTTINWELAITGSCMLKFDRVVPVDIFLVGGGQSGNSGANDANDPNACTGGHGGAGGTCVTQTNVTLTEGVSYTITIGGSDSSTSMTGTGFSKTASSGGGASGGAGGTAYNGGRGSGPAGGSNGSYAFNSSTSLVYSGRKYGAGGGGARCMSTNYTMCNDGVIDGGADGGGQGGGNPQASGSGASGRNGVAGLANYGAGGGGACRIRGGSVGTPGSGGSGIVIIRNHR